QDPYETADRSDALLFLTEWKEFLNLNFSRIKGLLRRPLILDGRNMLDKERLTKLGFEYVGVGR
ncbi:MAG TPA: UDP-glucose 6-dehydrogenase, partial [Candidatus Latescibacteria bacterium]|nr:UDP-glucose 6-dehydrogenase [Candidatus Latescibacterota bacterium]